ncbi:hypothetical protein FOA52_014149 [Chlamydomonas sp. UWO 241]|nr:hypothetical protein FOA52_014149 [Chlamydomonas sp. UWO 241]
MDAATAELDCAEGLGCLPGARVPLPRRQALGLELLSAVAAGVQKQDAKPEGGALPESGVGRKRKGSSSCYLGVSWHKGRSSREVKLRDPQAKRQLHIGSYASEEDAARAYDYAAVQAQGPGAERNFPGETISEAPVCKGVERKQRSSSRYHGVSWKNHISSWYVRLWDPQTKRDQYIGSYASEKDAARAYDHAAVQAHGPGAKRSFPGETISEAPVTKGEEWKQQHSSRYHGVCWDKDGFSWRVSLYDP